MVFRPYNAERDENDVLRVWKECGWNFIGDDKDSREVFRRCLDAGTADVAEYRGSAECLVTSHRGTIRMLDTDLPFRALTSVAAGRPLRRMGAAGELTARAVMNGALEGDAVAGLGCFDQGYYDRLGFGTFSYARTVRFDPLSLKVPSLARAPIRLGREHLGRIVESTAKRMNHHGLVKIPLEDFIAMFFVESESGFCLGFEDGNGELTHHLFAKPEGENGPYEIWWFVYRDYAGLIELLSFIRSLGDQVNTFEIREPWGIQFQDLLKRPMRTREISEGGRHENYMTAYAEVQVRILDLEKVLAPLKLPAGALRFNLELSDPIEAFLPGDAEWKGAGGRWRVELGEGGSAAARGGEAKLPTMRASVGAFTRLVFGVASASGLAVTDGLEAPAALLGELDERIRLPVPDAVQDF